MAAITEAPEHSNHDVVIVGGAMMGSFTAWLLTESPDLDGGVLVVERDTTCEACSTARTDSCMHQQFSEGLNVRFGKFAAEFVNDFWYCLGGDERVPEILLRSRGCMHLADTEGFADVLRAILAVQRAAGAGTVLMTVDEIKADHPFRNVDDIVPGSINTVDEGYWDGPTVFDWLRRNVRERDVEYVENEVAAMTRPGGRIESVTLHSGDVAARGRVVNASGPRASRTAGMAALDVPVEPRKRFSRIFFAERPLERDLPLTVDPTGVHVRENGGGTHLAGGCPDHEPAVDCDDFTMDRTLWQDLVGPTLAARIPRFEAIKVTSEWAGHCACNTLDQNAIMGPHPEVGSFIFLNGFSGHGLRQSPAMGRGTAEWLTCGEYGALDLALFNCERIVKNAPIVERAVI